MQKVKITISNFQCYGPHPECIVLEEGLTILQAQSNNVGKSTVFRAIKLLVEVEKLSGNDIAKLIRSGADSATISYEWDNQLLTLILYKNSRGVYSYKFIQDDMEFLTPPQSLIQALDLFVLSSAINMLEADKIQLFVEESDINNSILERLFVDSKIENVKGNLKQIQMNAKEDLALQYNTKATASSLLEGLCYNPYQPLYSAESDGLMSLAKINDLLIPLRELKHTNILSISLLKLMSFLGKFISIETLEVSSAVLQLVRDISQYPRDIPNTGILECLLAINKFTLNPDILPKSVFDISWYFAQLTQEHQLLRTLNEELKQLCNQARRDYPSINCPIRGEVLYDDIQCIPLNN